jgi:hypothetical protein
MGIVAPSAHQSGSTISASTPSTEKTIQNTLRSAGIFYGVVGVASTDESRGTAGAVDAIASSVAFLRVTLCSLWFKVLRA